VRRSKNAFVLDFAVIGDPSEHPRGYAVALAKRLAEMQQGGPRLWMRDSRGTVLVAERPDLRRGHDLDPLLVFPQKASNLTDARLVVFQTCPFRCRGIGPGQYTVQLEIGPEMAHRFGDGAGPALVSVQ
jgi:hypothetical protein